MDQSCAIPADFELGAFWEQSIKKFKTALPSYFARFRVTPDVFPRLRFAGRFARVDDKVERDLDGWFRVSVRFDVEEMACEYALSFGPNLEVLEPRSLREKVIAAAQQVLEFYAKA